MSHKLQVGEMRVSFLTDKEIWGHFNFIFSSKSRNSTTYKFVLIKSLLENLYNVNDKLELNYLNLFGSFARIYWNLVVHHNLNQINMVGKRSEVQKILLQIQEKNQIPNTLVFDRLSDELQLQIINRVKRACKLNVMGAIYGDTGSTIYDFDNKKEFIRFNPAFYSFMQRFQRVLNYLTNYQLALFLEKFNEFGDTTNLLTKVENVSKRSSLDSFYQILCSFYDGKCFYCGKCIKKKESSHVDHFIPWSFVQADQLWNLVISCSACNLSKSDKLANENFLYLLIDRNEMLMKDQAFFLREDMKVYSNKKIEELYSYSIDNGITDFWVPKIVGD
ncbi:MULTISPECIES: HNH endonuclease [unclassified Bacillus (in: firmicutes)]|uniref:HNH endonuclease n=1 Tax=unclassified Bacillus (in: firmicutes) TaxID=185979 RepID=UPI0008E680D5|nr:MULTISPECIES: HNH endonuclease domain-containing protein [unclassified Bacillus (in: firmicutes)]SFA86516.1 HNH endonuclease [Bacillus sp. UNCCL13]SFQ83731.1 HNH endonuclease [Bacillus sp. cl95]